MNSEVISHYAEKILSLCAWLISSDNFLERIEAKEIISTVSKAIGLSKIIKILRMNLESSETEIWE